MTPHFAPKPAISSPADRPTGAVDPRAGGVPSWTTAIATCPAGISSTHEPDSPRGPDGDELRSLFDDIGNQSVEWSETGRWTSEWREIQSAVLPPRRPLMRTTHRSDVEDLDTVPVLPTGDFTLRSRASRRRRAGQETRPGAGFSWSHARTHECSVVHDCASNVHAVRYCIAAWHRGFGCTPAQTTSRVSNIDSSICPSVGFSC